MKKIKIIDLFNMIANGEIDEDIKIEFQYGYNYEYCTIREFFDRYILDKEHLNQEITLEDTPKEETKIPEKLEEKEIEITMSIGEQVCANKINEIIDYLKSKGE